MEQPSDRGSDPQEGGSTDKKGTKYMSPRHLLQSLKSARIKLLAEVDRIDKQIGWVEEFTQRYIEAVGSEVGSPYLPTSTRSSGSSSSSSVVEEEVEKVVEWAKAWKPLRTSKTSWEESIPGKAIAITNKTGIKITPPQLTEIVRQRLAGTGEDRPPQGHREGS